MRFQEFPKLVEKYNQNDNEEGAGYINRDVVIHGMVFDGILNPDVSFYRGDFQFLFGFLRTTYDEVRQRVGTSFDPAWLRLLFLSAALLSKASLLGTDEESKELFAINRFCYTQSIIGKVEALKP